MNLTHTISVEPGLLRVVVTGEFSLDEAKRGIVEILEAVVQHQIENVLIDGRAVSGEVQPMERYWYAEFMAGTIVDFASRGLSPVPRLAYVMNEPILDPQRFGETVAVNRGVTGRSFDNLDEALAWLGTVASGEPQSGDQ